MRPSVWNGDYPEDTDQGQYLSPERSELSVGPFWRFAVGAEETVWFWHSWKNGRLVAEGSWPSTAFAGRHSRRSDGRRIRSAGKLGAVSRTEEPTIDGLNLTPTQSWTSAHQRLRRNDSAGDQKGGHGLVSHYQIFPQGWVYSCKERTSSSLLPRGLVDLIHSKVVWTRGNDDGHLFSRVRNRFHDHTLWDGFSLRAKNIARIG